MKMNAKVEYADGSVADVVISAPDFVAFETKYDRSVARFATEIKFTDICWLAWHRLHRDKKAGEFEAWLETIDGVNLEETEEIVPLDKTAHTS
jgi:hypothetical protein